MTARCRILPVAVTILLTAISPEALPGTPVVGRAAAEGSRPAVAAVGTSRAARGASAATAKPVLLAPAEAFRIPYENLDGAVLVRADLHSSAGVDTSGWLVLDTGAGYLSLAPALLRRLQLADVDVEPMTFAPRPLGRLRVGPWSQDVVGPVLGVETEVIEQTIDRKVLGLIGYEPLSSFAIRLDYRVDTLALIAMRRDGITASPPTQPTAAHLAAGAAAFQMARNASREALAGALGATAIPIPFEIAGDGKILVTGRLASSPRAPAAEALTLLLDTGATKSVIFRRAFERSRGNHVWPELHGLSAPTLYGNEVAYMARVPRLSAGNEGTAGAADVDVAVMESDLESALSRAVQRPVDGLLGYSYLRHFRLTVDYPHRILWLEPVAVGRDQRRYEYSHVGVQIERREGALRVVAVAVGSPAAAAGIRDGDEVAGIDARDAASLDVIEASRRLEGAPGTRVTLRIRKPGAVRTYRLTRRVLL